MQLPSLDRALVELRISGYQYPDTESRGEGGWDANWLLVGGTVTQADGETWSFEDPCLTTWEAGALGKWLRDVAAGTVSPPPGIDEPEQLLVFTEPNIAFSMAARTANRMQIRVHFSLEALPPWLQAAGRPEIFEYFLVLNISIEELTKAAEDWTLNLTRFPRR